MPDGGQIVVMKFGGTSVAGPEELKRAARRIVASREGGNRVVAVLSARGTLQLLGTRDRGAAELHHHYLAAVGHRLRIRGLYAATAAA